jgi:hypothetical protein
MDENENQYEQPEQEKEQGKELSELKLGKFSYRGPLRVLSALFMGIVIGGFLISLAVYSYKPSPLVDVIANNAISTIIAKTPTQTPMPLALPVTVEVVETVEVIKTVEVTRVVEVEKVLVETVEVVREVEVEKIVTVIVEVTPTPLSLPDVLESRLVVAFNEAGDYLRTGDPESLSNIWVGRDSLTAEISHLINIFGGITIVEWVVNDTSVLKQEPGIEVYTLSIDTTLTISGSYGCGGERIRDTLDISYPGLLRAEIQNLDLGIVRIYSWTNERFESIAVELCSPTPP